MNDTPAFIKKKQIEIINQKSNLEKLRISCDMITASLEMAYSLVKRQNPTFSHRQIIARRFEMMYKTNFSPEKLQEIKDYLLNCDENNEENEI